MTDEKPQKKYQAMNYQERYNATLQVAVEAFGMRAQKLGITPTPDTQALVSAMLDAIAHTSAVTHGEIFKALPVQSDLLWHEEGNV